MVLNKELFEDNLVSDLAKHFQARKPYESGSAQILSKGYPLFVFRNFLDNEFAKELRETVMSLPFKHKATDLFDFYQSPDLKPFFDEHDNPISRVCKEIFSPNFAGTIGRIIAKPLGTEIDFAAQKYCKGQYLLCHDDRLESRRVAFVLYLVDEAWSEQDGGQFDKYGVDFRGAPTLEPVESFTPSWNTLVFFEVSMWSHHQVAEVLGNLPRLSVAGWLHDAPKRIEEPSSSEFGDLGLLPTENILTTTSKFTRILIPDDNPALLELIRTDTFANCFDYPTWPVCVKLDHTGYFDEPVTGLDGSEREVFLMLVSSPSPIKVLGRPLDPGETTIFTATNSSTDPSRIHIEHCLEPDQECTFIYWSFLRLKK